MTNSFRQSRQQRKKTTNRENPTFREHVDDFLQRRRI